MVPGSRNVVGLADSRATRGSAGIVARKLEVEVESKAGVLMVQLRRPATVSEFGKSTMSILVGAHEGQVMSWKLICANHKCNCKQWRSLERRVKKKGKWRNLADCTCTGGWSLRNPGSVSRSLVPCISIR